MGNILTDVTANFLPETASSSPRIGHRLRLASLGPRFDEDRHQLYYDLLVRAIDTEGTFNVALTGAYGTGKSSILDRLFKDRRNEVVELSLSTIAPELHEGVEDAEESVSTTVTSRTNRIQKEIVKQLLYRLPPSRVPRSRFRRTSAPDRLREWGLAAVIGVTAFGVLLGLGLVQRLVEGLFPELWRQLVAYILLSGLVVVGAWAIGNLARGRPLVAASVNTGPATVSLSRASETYFDEYLDEIFYFFQVRRPKVVVIEDIDRFEDVQVFDTLRALNTLLNSSEQMDGRIVFVYAIRDSVFEQIGTSPEDRKTDAAKATLERASRTKFFDLIIPVVPFVSADNARDVMSSVMASDEFTIDPALIRLAARHVADMRFIFNIRNEFEVYRSRLVVPDDRGHVQRVPGITDDLVFAIVLFKNTHLADFEKLRQQDSALDRLYAKWRELVSANLDDRSAQLRGLQAALHNQKTANSRAADLGQRLLSFAESLQQAAQRNSRPATATLAGVATPDNVCEEDTWAAIAAGQSQTIAISPRPGYGRVALSFSGEQLANLLRTSVDPAEWESADLSVAEGTIARIQEEIDFLRHHTWADLCARPEFTLPATRDKLEDGPPEHAVSFDQLVEESLESDLARDLVRGGFLTSHFALYSSTYYGEHLGPNAMEYIRRCVEPGTPDASFALSEDDVSQVLREQGAAESDDADLLSDPSVFNISIMDYLFERRPSAAETVARRLVHLGEKERAFVDVYVAQGKHPRSLLTAMAPRWPGILRYVAGSAAVDPTTRPSVMDACLRALARGAYEVDDQVRRLFETSYREIEAVTRPGSAERAELVLRLVDASGAVLESVQPLDAHARRVIVELRLYPVTHANLRELVPGVSIALDDLQAEHGVYRYAIDRLADYLVAVQASPATKHTVRDPNSFNTILTDVAKEPDGTLLGQLIASASEGCHVQSLVGVPSSVWRFLAEGSRIDPTFENVKKYIDEFGIEQYLGSLLSGSEVITDAEDVPQDARLAIGVKILGSRDVIPEAAVRVRLVASLNPGVVPATSLQPESGPLVSLLLQAGLLADDRASFAERLMVDWSTYEAAICASTNFATFVSPELLSLSQIPDLLRSSVDNAVKMTIVNQIGDYLVGASKTQVGALIRVLNSQLWTVGYATLEALRSAGAEPGQLIQLMGREGDQLSVEHLKTLLRGIGGDYARVASGGRGSPNFEDDAAHFKVLSRLVGDTISRVEPESFKTKGRRLVANLITPRQ